MPRRTNKKKEGPKVKPCGLCKNENCEERIRNNAEIDFFENVHGKSENEDDIQGHLVEKLLKESEDLQELHQILESCPDEYSLRKNQNYLRMKEDIEMFNTSEKTSVYFLLQHSEFYNEAVFWGETAVQTCEDNEIKSMLGSVIHQSLSKIYEKLENFEKKEVSDKYMRTLLKSPDMYCKQMAENLAQSGQYDEGI